MDTVLELQNLPAEDETPGLGGGDAGGLGTESSLSLLLCDG
jgi:hypothetical protein